jgi:hypothetical protein
VLGGLPGSSLLFLSHLRISITMAESALPGIPGYDPDNLQPWTVAVVASVTVLATVAVALRLFSRHLKAQKLWWDDYMIIFSLVGPPSGTGCWYYDHGTQC